MSARHQDVLRKCVGMWVMVCPNMWNRQIRLLEKSSSVVDSHFQRRQLDHISLC